MCKPGNLLWSPLWPVIVSCVVPVPMNYTIDNPNIDGKLDLLSHLFPSSSVELFCRSHQC